MLLRVIAVGWACRVVFVIVARLKLLNYALFFAYLSTNLL